jgi:hypothetical protein
MRACRSIGMFHRVKACYGIPPSRRRKGKALGQRSLSDRAKCTHPHSASIQKSYTAPVRTAAVFGVWRTCSTSQLSSDQLNPLIVGLRTEDMVPEPETVQRKTRRYKQLPKRETESTSSQPAC